MVPSPVPQSKLPPDAAVLAPILRQLLDHEHGWIFAEPVDTKQWPDYNKVRRPSVDIRTCPHAAAPILRSNLESAAFGSVSLPPLSNNCSLEIPA